MRSGTCPKCGGTDVHPALHSNANSIRPAETIHASTVYTSHYVCRTCGYVEEWVKPQEMPMLQHSFGRE
jgi:C4-type Zn-finger protein